MSHGDPGNVLEQTTPQEDHRYHYYTGSRIPWYLRLMWLLFWCFSAYYAIRFFFPALQQEIVTPP